MTAPDERCADAPVVFTHTTGPGGMAARCGSASGPIQPWGRITDPDHPAVFDCPACWQDIAGTGVEPMGGLRP